jgi:hypothetical protein
MNGAVEKHPHLYTRLIMLRFLSCMAELRYVLIHI